MFEALSIRNAFSAVRNVLPVILAIASTNVATAAIDSPRSIKQPPTLQREVLPEFSNIRLDRQETFFKNVNDLELVFRPIAWDWIEPSERGEKVRPELDRGRTKSDPSISRNGKSVGN